MEWGGERPFPWVHISAWGMKDQNCAQMTKAERTQLQYQPQGCPTLLYFGLGTGAYADKALGWKSGHLLTEMGAQDQAVLCHRPMCT